MVGLLDVQKAALKAAAGHRGFAYWMEMGLGKTLTAFTEFIHLVADAHKVTRLVVVCPNSFKSGWLDEAEKHNLPVDLHIFESGGDNGTWVRKAFTRPPVLVINYEAIRSVNVQEYILRFIARRNAMIVFDESIQIKNNSSQQTKAAIRLGQHFNYVRLLSGKPMTQGPHDLWGQLKAAGLITTMNFWAFRNTFCKMGGYLNKKVVGAQNEALLASMVDPHVFRATKADWTDLPPKVYTIRDVKMAASQRSRYDSMEEEFVAWLNDREEVTVEMAITKHIKLAQIQFGFIIDESGDTRILVDVESNPLLNAIQEIIEEEVVGKVVVCYHHRYAAIALAKALEKYNPVFIRGGMGPDETSKNKDVFNNDPNCRVICIQTTAGRYGHTLIGGPEPENQCSTMVFAENTWSLDTRSQLEDRIHRHGQIGESCLYIDLVSSKLGRQIAGALQHKQNIFDAVMQHIGRQRVKA